MQQSQPIDSKQVEGLSSQFQRRWEAGFAWTSACSAFQLLTGVRGFWPMSAIASNGDLFDQSGNGRLLTYNGNPTYNTTGLAPYLDLDGAGDFLSRADEAGLDILGTEAYIAASRRGLTFGGWFWRDVQQSQDFMAKGGAAGTQAYTLYNTGANDNIRVEIHDGGGVVGHTFAGGSGGISRWEFLVGRFDPGASFDVFVNDTASGAATASAAIRNTAGSLLIGSGPAANDLDGRVSIAFLCATVLSTAHIRSLFHKTKALYGVK